MAEAVNVRLHAERVNFRKGECDKHEQADYVVDTDCFTVPMDSHNGIADRFDFRGSVGGRLQGMRAATTRLASKHGMGIARKWAEALLSPSQTLAIAEASAARQLGRLDDVELELESKLKAATVAVEAFKRSKPVSQAVIRRNVEEWRKNPLSVRVVG